MTAPAESAAESPIVWIERAVAADTAKRVDHRTLNVALSAGLSAIVGTPADGTLDIAPLVSGITARRAGKLVAGYGAPAKGNTLLNYCGVGPELLRFTVDRSPHKQGRYLPGVQIPIHAPERILEARPAYVFILPWNLQDEIIDQMAAVRDWGGKFVVPIPELRII